MKPFKDFLHLWRTDTLESDATWRSYDIRSATAPAYAKKALKALGFGYAGELGMTEFMAKYGVTTRLEAEALLSCWWVWHRLSTGERLLYIPKRISSLDRQVPGQG